MRYSFAKDLPGERWRQYHQHPMIISNLGRVRSLALGRYRMLKPFPNQGGYLMVNWREGAARFARLVHRMVLEVFSGPQPADKPHGCHYDGDKRNNRHDNLRWDSAASNALDNLRLGRGPIKLTKQDAMRINRMLLEGHSNRTVAKLFNLSAVAVGNIGSGRAWGHVTGRTLGDPTASQLAAKAGKRERSKYGWQASGSPHYVPRGSFDGELFAQHQAELAECDKERQSVTTVVS